MEEDRMDWIETVKDQHDSYLVNGSMSVPKAEGNRHYRDVLEWMRKGNKPSPPDYIQEELEEQEQQARREAERKAKYLEALEHLLKIEVAKIESKTIDKKHEEELIKIVNEASSLEARKETK